MYDKKRAEVLKDYLRKWDWKLFPLMPIAEEDAVYLLRIIDMYDKDRKRRREYSREHRSNETIHEMHNG